MSIDFDCLSERVRCFYEMTYGDPETTNANTLLANNLEFPMQLISQHQRLSVYTGDLRLNSEYIAYVTKILYLLNVWHAFTLEKNILYTISDGSLLGYCWDKCPILWDDDVDLLMRSKDWAHLEAMWNSNTHKHVRIWDDNWHYKLITIQEIELQLIRYKFNQD